MCSAAGPTAASPLDECAIPAPVSAYGETKLLGEQYVQRFCRRHFIVRTAWLYGAAGKNFVKTMVSLAKTHDEITVVSDQLGNPTNAVDLAYHILKLAVSHDYGTYHCTGNGVCSWYDFACEIIRLSGEHCTVKPISSAEYAAPTPAGGQPPGLERPGQPDAALHRGRRNAGLENCDPRLFCKLGW